MTLYHERTGSFSDASKKELLDFAVFASNPKNLSYPIDGAVLKAYAKMKCLGVRIEHALQKR